MLLGEPRLCASFEGDLPPSCPGLPGGVSAFSASSSCSFCGRGVLPDFLGERIALQPASRLNGKPLQAQAQAKGVVPITLHVLEPPLG